MLFDEQVVLCDFQASKDATVRYDRVKLSGNRPPVVML